MNGTLGNIPCREHTTKGVLTMTDAYDELPFEEDAGTVAVWNIVDRNDRLNVLDAMFLGMGSSHRPEHKGHPETAFAPRGVHCSTCRWTEIRLFQDVESSRLYVVKCGVSNVPDERDLIEVSSVATPFELVESLTTTDRRSGRPILPMPSRMALAQSVSYSDSLRDAYINSPVTRS